MSRINGELTVTNLRQVHGINNRTPGLCAILVYLADSKREIEWATIYELVLHLGHVWGGCLGNCDLDDLPRQYVESAVRSILAASDRKIDCVHILEEYHCLRTRAVETSAIRRVATEADACPICLEDIVVGQTIEKLPCGHVYHGMMTGGCTGGVVKWLAEHFTCPMCRRVVHAGSTQH